VSVDSARADVSELFDADLIPVIRRLGERRRGDSGLTDTEGAGTRLAVWQGLAGVGVMDLALPSLGGGLRAIAPVAELMGTALYQSPFFDTVMAADLIAAAGLDPEGELAGRVADGSATIAVAAREQAADDLLQPAALEIASGDRVLVSGDRRFVAFAADVDYLLAVGLAAGQAGPALIAVVVPADQPGVTLRRHDDLGRGDLYHVRLDQAACVPAGPDGRGWPGPGTDLPGLWRQVLARAQLRLACYLAGLSHGAIDLTAGYARERQVFGQPLAKFQAPAFRLAALAARLEAVRALAHRACEDGDEGDDIALGACQALLLAGDLAADASAEAIQLHGSYGLTEDCDAQLFYRRALVDALLLGTRRQLRRQAAGLAAVRSGPAGRGRGRGEAADASS
jgi:alkylation response protein AidB-like acyl-CoA dehydrogenase